MVEVERYDVDKYERAELEYLYVVELEHEKIKEILADIEKLFEKYHNKVSFIAMIEALQSALAHVTIDYVSKLKLNHDEKEIVLLVIDYQYRKKLVEYKRFRKERKQQLGFR